MGIITKFTVNLEHEIGENSSNCLRYCPHCLPDEYTSWYPQRNVELFSWASLSMSPFAFSGLQTNYFSDTLHTYVLIHLVLDLYYACIYIFQYAIFFNSLEWYQHLARKSSNLAESSLFHLFLSTQNILSIYRDQEYLRNTTSSLFVQQLYIFGKYIVIVKEHTQIFLFCKCFVPNKDTLGVF